MFDTEGGAMLALIIMGVCIYYIGFWSFLGLGFIIWLLLG